MARSMTCSSWWTGCRSRENRSPGFAPPIESSDVESMRVMTAGFPAEYGRKLGGVVEVTSPKNYPAGLHGEFDADGGSFATASGSGALFYSSGENRFSVSGDGFHSDRYLDPPVLQNYTNIGNAGGFSASYERDFSNGDRALPVTFEQHAVRYVVPNELSSSMAGQRQDVSKRRCAARFTYTHAFSSDVLLSVAGSMRDTIFRLSFQSRNPRRHRLAGSWLSRRIRARGPRGPSRDHDWKVGVDGIFSPVNEKLQYQITDPSQFDPDYVAAFSIFGSTLGHRTVRLRPGSNSSRQMERERRPAL